MFLGRLGLATASFAAAVGCAGPRMVPPADVAQKSDVIEATDRSAMTGALADESFKLGPYLVAEVDRDWDDKSGFSAGGYSKSSTNTAYKFQFKEGAEELAAQCTSITNSQGFALGGGGSLDFSNTKLTCSCGEAVKLELAGKQDGLEGTVTLGEASYTVKSVNETDSGTQSRPAGFRVDLGEEAAGAVEVNRPGRIWLNKTLEATSRRQLGCLFAGAMLYQAPSSN
jgi:hypothetical protein